MLERMESMEATFSRLDSRLETLEGQLTNPGNLVSAHDIFFVCLNSSTKMAWFSLSYQSYPLNNFMVNRLKLLLQLRLFRGSKENNIAN